eukprot:TRINITY_DN5049_c0_g1_i1.p2 TRINITY_DN5049_c0_g1~~TRINITY_DN5049_c0_g1_i1.p2  ORF type:complete len:103 (-),score=25.97 TRINITY_DN5049_c0_g1_i1:110-418(-)
MIFLLFIAIIRFLAAQIGYASSQTADAPLARHLNFVAHLIEAIWITYETYEGHQERLAKDETAKKQKLSWAAYREHIGFGPIFYVMWVNVALFLVSDVILSR